MSDFVTKDSGKRAEFDSGMVRDTTEGKMQWHRVTEGPMLRRWVELLQRGAEKYPDLPTGEANWTLAAGPEEYQRFKESAFRHFMQWFYGEDDEDHAAAVMFNINGAEYVLGKTWVVSGKVAVSTTYSDTLAEVDSDGQPRANIPDTTPVPKRTTRLITELEDESPMTFEDLSEDEAEAFTNMGGVMG